MKIENEKFFRIGSHGYGHHMDKGEAVEAVALRGLSGSRCMFWIKTGLVF